MKRTYQILRRELPFKKPAVTSRNTFESRSFYLVELHDLDSGSKGLGEATPLAGLSIDDRPEHAQQLEASCKAICEGASLDELDLEAYPSIRFGLECALLDLQRPGPVLFDSPFTTQKKPIAINGLVWMSSPEHMLEEAQSKINEGFSCIKFKVGAQDFDAECRMLEKLRKRYSAFQIELRLDANGAFAPGEAAEQLRELARYEIHSIEQPIRPGQLDDMARLCRERIIPIALDEELIGVNVQGAETLLRTLDPQYLILKPNLIGGLERADQWISAAVKQDIHWWATSALESNIGLNFIAQWVSQYPLELPQGLGTGSLYRENFPAPLRLEGEWLHFDARLTS